MELDMKEFKFWQVDAFTDAHRAQREARGPRPDHQKQIQLLQITSSPC